MEDLTGRTCEAIGPYRLLREISTGSLHECMDPATGQRFALRLLPDHAPACSASEGCMRGRVLAAGQLRHPNLVAVHDCGWQDGVAYVATEWVEGAEPLCDYLERSGPLPVFQRLALVVQMLSVLAYAHGHRMVHGALDAGHLLVSRTGQLKVAGFGWAKAADADDSGSPAGPVDDVRAAAAIARDLLAGASTRGPAALAAVLNRALSTTSQPGEVTAARLSADLQAVFGRPAWAGEAAPPLTPVRSDSHCRSNRPPSRRPSPWQRLLRHCRCLRRCGWTCRWRRSPCRSPRSPCRKPPSRSRSSTLCPPRL